MDEMVIMNLSVALSDSPIVSSTTSNVTNQSMLISMLS